MAVWEVAVLVKASLGCGSLGYVVVPVIQPTTAIVHAHRQAGHGEHEEGAGAGGHAGFVSLQYPSSIATDTDVYVLPPPHHTID